MINLSSNCFINPDLYQELYKIEFKKKRLHDFEQLLKLYSQKNHKHWLYPSKTYPINQKRLSTYYSKFNDTNDRELASHLINNLTHVSFENFYESLKISILKFNETIKDDYIIILGANNSGGALNKFTKINNDNMITKKIPINKSSFWVLLLSYPFLKKKPKDIIFNFELALEFETMHYFKSKKYTKDFLFFDDCSYSGSQLFNNVIGKSEKELTLLASEFNYNINSKRSLLIKRNPSKLINIHLILPYISTFALNNLTILNQRSLFNMNLYNNYTIPTYYELIDPSTINKIKKNLKIYMDEYKTPIYFDHKFADGLSTIPSFILPGYIINKNSNKKSNKKIISYYPYIENCYKNKDFQQVIKNSEKKQSLIYDNNICIKGPYKIAYIEIKKIMDEKKL